MKKTKPDTLKALVPLRSTLVTQSQHRIQQLPSVARLND